MIRIGNKVVAGSADVDLSTVLKSLNKTGLSIWVGTQTEYDALAESVKNNEKTTFITYDTDEDVYLIVDTIISYGKTWSSVKISSELAKKINAADVYTKTQIDEIISAKLASALKYKGAVNTTALLPASAENGDTYFVKADGFMYAYNSTETDWDALGTVADMTNYFTKAEITAILQDKADKFQYDVLPTPSSETVGLLLQYTGADTEDYKNGYWYKGVDNGDSTYDWALHSVGDYYTKSEIDENCIYHGFHQAAADDTYVRLMIDNVSYLNGKFYCVDRSGNEYVITIKSGAPTSCYRPNVVSASTEYTKGIRYYTETVQKIHIYINNYQWDCLNYYFISDSGSKITKFDSNATEYNNANAIDWKQLATTNSIYKTISTNSITSAGEHHWFIVDDLYPSVSLQTATYIINGRNGGCYIMSCGTSDDVRKILPTITTISQGSGPLVGFNYDLATGQVELQSNQYNTLFITQISGVRNDFTIENETNTPQLSTVGVMESIATKSNSPYKVYDNFSNESTQLSFNMESGAHYECKVYYYGGLCGIYALVMDQFGSNGGWISTVWEHNTFKFFSISVEQSTGVVSMAGTAADNVNFVIYRLP